VTEYLFAHACTMLIGAVMAPISFVCLHGTLQSAEASLAGSCAAASDDGCVTSPTTLMCVEQKVLLRAPDDVQ